MEKKCEQKIPLTKTLMVGDSYYDIQAGKNLGCLTCGIIGGYGKIKKELQIGDGKIKRKNF